ncbi:hypothetical protein [Calidifontibacter terrae]
MDVSDLAELVPTAMARHPERSWHCEVSVSGSLTGELSLRADPLRAARVLVRPGLEVFSAEIAGHVGMDFAYDDADRAGVLLERLDVAARALIGPSRVVLRRAGGRVVGSSLVIDPDGAQPSFDSEIVDTIGRIRAALGGHLKVRDEVIDYAVLPREGHD